MHARSYWLGLAFCWMFGLLVAGCGGSADAPNLGDWTLKTNDLTIVEDLQVSGTEAYFFGSITDLDVTSEGRVVVLDEDAMHLKVLRPDGTLIDTLGRRGQGPGEFQGVTSVDVARGDSVYVFDNQVDRLTVFSPPPTSERVRSMVITGGAGHPMNVRVLGDRLVGEVTPGYTRKEGLYRPSPNTWHRMDGASTSGAPLLKERRRQVATSFDHGIAIHYLPFGRVTRVAAGPDGRLYHGFTDSLQIRATSLDGATEVVASVPAKTVPVSDAGRDSLLAEVEDELRLPMEDALPDTKPAFTDLVVDEEERLWVRRPTERRGNQTATWWVLNPETKTVYECQLPAQVDLEVVQNGWAYGHTTTKTGSPALVRYRVDIDV